MAAPRGEPFAIGELLRPFDALLTVVLACSILATMQVLGVTLVAAVLVIPRRSPGC